MSRATISADSSCWLVHLLEGKNFWNLPPTWSGSWNCPAPRSYLTPESVSYTHLRAHETRHDLVCRLLLEKKKKPDTQTNKKNKNHKIQSTKQKKQTTK